MVKPDKKQEHDPIRHQHTVEQITEVLAVFNPVENKNDRKLANYLAGRELPPDELK